MTFYQELQLNQAGSKNLLKKSETVKEKSYHILVYLVKIAVTMAFCFLFVTIFSILFGNLLVTTLIIFIPIAIIGGTCFDFYRFNHFDDVLHITSGFIGCMAAKIIFYFSQNETNTRRKRLFFVIYMFMFSMGVASIWELIEFGLDKYLGFDCQAGGLTDTMFDILDCLVGSIIATTYYYFKIKKQDVN